jgi:hypothetical protein
LPIGGGVGALDAGTVELGQREGGHRVGHGGSLPQPP